MLAWTQSWQVVKGPREEKTQKKRNKALTFTYTDGGDGATTMETDEARQPAGAGDEAGQSAGAAGTGGTAPAQASESDASYYTEDMPIAAYQPVVTRVTQPAADAGDEGDTEAPRRNRRTPRPGRMQKRKQAGKARAGAAAAVTPLRPTGDGDESDLQ